MHAPYKDDEESEGKEEEPVYLEEETGSRDEGSDNQQSKEVEGETNKWEVG